MDIFLKRTRLKQHSAFWEIVGFDSTTQIFRAEIPVGEISTRNVEQLLCTLTAKHGLSDTEISESLLKRNVKGYKVHLEIQRSIDVANRTTTYSCGCNPYFIARVCRPQESRSA
jgi:hypothetical protein